METKLLSLDLHCGYLESFKFRINNVLKYWVMTKKFKCLVCGYIHEGETAPEECPICCVGAEDFEEVEE